MHGYTDSINVPLHLPASAFKPSASSSNSSSNNAKGKGKATSQDAPRDGMYDVVANWTPQDQEQVEQMVQAAPLRAVSFLRSRARL